MSLHLANQAGINKFKSYLALFLGFHFEEDVTRKDVNHQDALFLFLLEEEEHGSKGDGRKRKLPKVFPTPNFQAVLVFFLYRELGVLVKWLLVEQEIKAQKGCLISTGCAARHSNFGTEADGSHYGSGSETVGSRHVSCRYMSQTTRSWKLSWELLLINSRHDFTVAVGEFVVIILIFG